MVPHLCKTADNVWIYFFHSFSSIDWCESKGRLLQSCVPWQKVLMHLIMQQLQQGPFRRGEWFMSYEGLASKSSHSWLPPENGCGMRFPWPIPKTNSARSETTRFLNHCCPAVSALQLIVHGCPAAEDVVHALCTSKVKETSGMKPNQATRAGQTLQCRFRATVSNVLKQFITV